MRKLFLSAIVLLLTIAKAQNAQWQFIPSNSTAIYTNSGNVGIGISDNFQSMLTLGGGNISFKHPDNSAGLKAGIT